jgi:hypothetical protein
MAGTLGKILYGLGALVCCGVVLLLGLAVLTMIYC